MFSWSFLFRSSVFLSFSFSYLFFNFELSINKNFDVFYWTVCDRIFQSRLVHKRELKKYLIPESNKNILNFFIDKYGAQTISMETNNEIPDDHLGEMGHQVIADKFYEDIISKI